MAAIVWPMKLLPSQEPSFHLRGMNKSGPLSDSGAGDIISGDAGFWVATLSDVVVTTRERVQTFRAIAAMLQGRLNPIVIPYCSLYQPLVAGFSPRPLPHSDDTFFSDRSGYLTPGASVLTIADLPVRAVSATVSIRYSGTLQPGQVFSFGNRLYELTSVSGSTIKWQPPLREAVPAGTELNFTNPVCQMRLATDDEMRLSLEMNRRGFPTVNLVEDLIS